MAFNISIPVFPGAADTELSISLEPGSSTFLVGANGSGKSRLAMLTESQLGAQAHRISAHRALTLNPSVPKITEKRALAGLRYGSESAKNENNLQLRRLQRWSNSSNTTLLNDFDFLLQSMFADQANVSLDTHLSFHEGTLQQENLTKFQKLSQIWNKVLPNRTLVFSGDDVLVKSGDATYSASELSDGERSVFYMVGQVLSADQDSVLIFDEPELHIHRSILSKLWDEVESARPDCAFLVITHDLDFAASRAARKFAVRRFVPTGLWEMEEVPRDTGFSEEISTLILGSRRPILFVEGDGGSLDLVIYRACYPEWTVLPRGGCEDVIHAVATMRKNAALTRITCSGIVDADDYSSDDRANLSRVGVEVLPVSEIENLVLLPDIATAILEEDNFEGAELEFKLSTLTKSVLEEVKRVGAIDEVVLRYCRRRIDRTLKAIDFKDVGTPAELSQTYNARTAALDIQEVALEVRERIDQSIATADMPKLLANFDNKALIAIAARHLKGMSKSSFESWLGRTLQNPKAEKLRRAIQASLPQLTAQ